MGWSHHGLEHAKSGGESIVGAEGIEETLMEVQDGFFRASVEQERLNEGLLGGDAFLFNVELCM